MRRVCLVVQAASKLLPTELICTGQIWEEREVGEFAPGSPCFLALLSRAGLPPCQLGVGVRAGLSLDGGTGRLSLQSPKVPILHCPSQLLVAHLLVRVTGFQKLGPSPPATLLCGTWGPGELGACLRGLLVTSEPL